MRQRRDSVTLSGEIARKVDTPSSLTIHQARRQAAAASVVVSDPLDVSYILRRRLRCCCCCCCWSLRDHLPPPTPSLLSYIPWDRRRAPTASVVVSDPSDASYIPRPPLTPPLLLLIPQACLPLPLLRRRCQFPGLVNILPPPPLETFTQACCLFCFLRRRLCRRRQVLRIIFLCRRLCHYRQFLKPVIAMQ